MIEQVTVTREKWLEARKALLVKEKEFTRLRDELSAKRRELPRVRIDKEYIFEGPDGKQTLSQLFNDKSQLMIYHFMFGPDWEEGCPSCSFWADNFNGTDIHLAQCDITFLVLSRTTLDRINSYKKRMGWSFKWLSSLDSDFNYDFNVSFGPQHKQQNEIDYNYLKQPYFLMN